MSASGPLYKKHQEQSLNLSGDSLSEDLAYSTESTWNPG